MAEAARKADGSSKWPELPTQATTKEGYQFSPLPKTWSVSSVLRRTFRYHFERLDGLSTELTHLIRLTFLDVLQKQSVAHAQNMYACLLEFHDDIYKGLREKAILVELSHILNWRSCLDERTVWKLGVLRVLFERAASLGYPLLTEESSAYLRAAVLPGNPKGGDVRTRDEKRGAFSTIELETINSAINTAYVTGEVSLLDYALSHVILAYGCRSVQIGMLKECDLIETNGTFTLRIPRAKQRGELRRESFKVRSCDRRLGELLQRLIVQNESSAAACLPKEHRPLFPARVEGTVPGFTFHMTAFEIGSRIQSVLEPLVGFHTNAKRFRHTLAKRAHDDGADIYVLAELLDHSDTQNVKVYTEGGPDIVERLNRTMALELAPLAQAFAGKLVNRNDPDARAGGASKRIHERALPDGQGKEALGTCGLNSFCSLARPVACYTCINFRPWDDGPHEQVLGKLLADRDEQRDKGYAPRIYGLHDRTIAAVARVVQLCDERRMSVEAAA